MAFGVTQAPLLAQTGQTRTSDEPAAVLPSPVLTLDPDALFSGSAFGKRVIAELERDRAALAAENRRIEQELVSRESELTGLRPTVSAEAFSEMAAEFDTTVQRMRTEQERKSRLLQERLEAERTAFRTKIGPVLVELVRASGAVAILDRAAVLISFQSIDVTQEAIAAIDAALGSGQSELSIPDLVLPNEASGLSPATGNQNE
ncbi:MAG: OmpH family outer membrane protein [Mangrovicoccus sp.]